ncbi:maleylpyruvate isomerase family mycothiol-dependent enzyme [Nocardioides sp. B-3]|uniref:maleylpyruvate isomerase family mycothiol-dependent enzyme n=1 Tax=Nocardioides sp. B-3 TaxID=2895565 RepID=UPI0021529044|nr:maleylpyruvate isomerase family mycothiol-dependent enzyme [Nocardioides sp. B-3]UUZ58498.1 maleylpyruvate isomerase family mycothiol-dependent enzyme [Nocardioides sp. B-3]
MTETAQRFIERADALAAILDSSAQQWDAPTPCEGWTVRDVVAHVIDSERDFLARRGFDPGLAPDVTDSSAARRDHAKAVAEILGQAGVAEREYDGHFGRTTIAATMADFYGWDPVIHGSDVARATGQPRYISDSEAASPGGHGRRLGRRALLRGRLYPGGARARRRLRHGPPARRARSRPGVAAARARMRTGPVRVCL